MEEKRFKGLGQVTSLDKMKLAIFNIPLDTISLYILMIWIFSPIIVMIRNIKFTDYSAEVYIDTLINIQSFWVQILFIVGWFGLILSIFGLIRSYRENKSFKKMIKNNLSFFLILLTLIWAIFSTINSDNLHNSIFGAALRIEGLITYFAYLGILFMGYSLKDKRQVLKLLKYFVLTATVLSFLMIIDVETINRLFFFVDRSAVFHNRNYYGYYACIASMAAATLFVISENKYKDFLYGVAFIILTAALIKNNSFGPYLALILGFIFLFTLIYFSQKHKLKKFSMVFGLFIATSFFMDLATSNVSRNFSGFTSDIYDVATLSEDAGMAGSSRWSLWMQGLKFTREKPLLGYGPDNLYDRYLLEGVHGNRVHNVFIQISASLGIPALIFFISSLLNHFLKVLRNITKQSLTKISINAIVFTFLVSAQFGVSLYCTSPFFVLFLGIALNNNLFE